MTCHILVKGKVQGVFFRATAKDVAVLNDLTGWIRNTDEGHVEVVVSGEEKDIAVFEDWCRDGPPRAEVDSVERSLLPEEQFSSFVVRR